MKNKLEDLRNHLFLTIEGLLDKDNPMDIKRAQAVANVGSAIINSAKVEVDFIKATGSDGSGFMDYSNKLDKPKDSSIKALKVAGK